MLSSRPAFAVARDHALKWIVVAVRGTLSLKDILTDCAVNSVPFLEGCGRCGAAAVGRARSRSGAAAQRLPCRHCSRRLRENLAEAARGRPPWPVALPTPTATRAARHPWLRRSRSCCGRRCKPTRTRASLCSCGPSLLADCEGYRLVFCGHSMGGAVSAMCVAMLRDKAASLNVRFRGLHASLKSR